MITTIIHFMASTGANLGHAPFGSCIKPPHIASIHTILRISNQTLYAIVSRSDRYESLLLMPPFTTEPSTGHWNLRYLSRLSFVVIHKYVTNQAVINSIMPIKMIGFDTKPPYDVSRHNHIEHLSVIIITLSQSYSHIARRV